MVCHPEHNFNVDWPLAVYKTTVNIPCPRKANGMQMTSFKLNAFLSRIYTRRFCQPTQNLHNSSKIKAKIEPKSVNSSHNFINRRSHCIEANFCLSLLGEFQNSADKAGVCRPALVYFFSDKTFFCISK